MVKLQSVLEMSNLVGLLSGWLSPSIFLLVSMVVTRYVVRVSPDSPANDPSANRWLTIALFILSSALAVALYLSGIRERQPYFVVSNQRTEILNRDMPAPITAFREDGTEILSGLSAARLYFWNAGKESIRPSHILSPLSVTLDDPQSAVIEARVLHQSRAVTAFTCKILTERMVSLEFDILEQRDGATLQVIYEGDPAASFLVSGVIEGVKEFNTVAPSSSWAWVLAGGMLLLPMITAVIAGMRGREHIINTREVLFAIVVWAFALLLLGYIAGSEPSGIPPEILPASTVTTP